MLYAKVFGCYKRLDKIPIFNWFEVLEGRYEYIYKRPIKRYPAIFGEYYLGMFYQMDKIDAEYFRKIHKLAYLRSLYATTSQIRFFNQANFLEAEIKKMVENVGKGQTLNEMLNIIEEAYNSLGTIDKHKMDAARFYSLYYKACDKLTPKKKRYANSTT
jgi:hypothetical protein